MKHSGFILHSSSFIPSAYGQGGIRTLDTLSCITVFETAAFDHSATCPTGNFNIESPPPQRPKRGRSNSTVLRRRLCQKEGGRKLYKKIKDIVNSGYNAGAVASLRGRLESL